MKLFNINVISINLTYIYKRIFALYTIGVRISFCCRWQCDSTVVTSRLGTIFTRYHVVFLQNQKKLRSWTDLKARG